MSQWLRRKIIAFMGNAYVWLDKGLTHETSPILDVRIDEDFKNMSRYELCNHIENKFLFFIQPIEGSVETKVEWVTFFGFFSNFYGKEHPVTERPAALSINVAGGLAIYA